MRLGDIRIGHYYRYDSRDEWGPCRSFVRVTDIRPVDGKVIGDVRFYDVEQGAWPGFTEVSLDLFQRNARKVSRQAAERHKPVPFRYQCPAPTWMHEDTRGAVKAAPMEGL